MIEHLLEELKLRAGEAKESQQRKDVEEHLAVHDAKIGKNEDDGDCKNCAT